MGEPIKESTKEIQEINKEVKEPVISEIYLLIYNTGRVKTQSVLFPDWIEQYNAGELTTVIELTKMVLFQGDNKWIQIPNFEYKSSKEDKKKLS